MKSQLNLKKAIITLLFVIIGSAVFAQTGKISGKVSDGKTAETLIGVTVKIKGTTKGAATDVEGRYVIGSIAPGKYTIEASYVGYATKNITEVEVKEDNVTVVDLIMDDSNDQKLKEVVITGNVSKESVNTLYFNQKASISISSGISAELIRKSPDRNTSEVLKRVSGASIQDNKFVIVRGLSDRYNSAMLNNSMLPNTEVDKRAFSFDILPSNLIDAIVINKTASADIPADFSG
ncbi:MAG TPA: TonB-dependent receptor, partial [Pedobacter sp.]|nr:TonB-dependent receptor [Pedobacter sp.]